LVTGLLGLGQVDEHHSGLGVQLYDFRFGPDGGAWLKSRTVDVDEEGVTLKAGPTLMMGLEYPERWHWLRVHLELPDAEIEAHYRVLEYETPPGMRAADMDEQYWSDVESGKRPRPEVRDWGYREYMVPLEVLRAHARIEGPFTLDAEIDEDRVLESTVEPGMDYEVEMKPTQGDQGDLS
jgi:hypothetical protein